MSDAVWVAMIGAGGTAVGAAAGAVGAILVARIQAAQKAALSSPPQPPGTTPVLGKAIDTLELRVLRALFGEPKGRYLGGYQDPYHRPALEATVKKGWVKKIEGRYYMTPEGADFCRAYLQQVLTKWQPTDGILA
jgi:hypothetical protein